MIILRPIIGDVKINAPIGSVLVDVIAATHVTNVGQIFAAPAISGKMPIVLTLSGRGRCVAIVSVVMVDVINIGNTNNDASYFIIVTTALLMMMLLFIIST